MSAEPPSFASVLRQHDGWPLRRGLVTTLQVNVGKLCNQACHHCHVDAGPKRTEIMTRATAERVVELLGASPNVETVDLVETLRDEMEFLRGQAVQVLVMREARVDLFLDTVDTGH